MADHDLWRKNIPEDFQGKMDEEWDGEIGVKAIYGSAAAIAGAVAFAFVLCWYMYGPLDATLEEVELSPLAEAHERRLPPTPWLQPKPEVELETMLHELNKHNSSYGWNDELNGLVRIPLDRAMDLVAESLGTTAAGTEPTEETPVDVEAAATESPADSASDAEHGTDHQGGAHG